LDFLHGNIFFTKNSRNTSPGPSGILRTAPFNLLIGKRGRRLPPSSPRPAPPEATQLQKTFWKAEFKISKLLFAPPILISSPPSFVIYGKVTEALRKHIEHDFLLFFLFPLTCIKLNMLI